MHTTITIEGTPHCIEADHYRWAACRLARLGDADAFASQVLGGFAEPDPDNVAPIAREYQRVTTYCTTHDLDFAMYGMIGNLARKVMDAPGRALELVPVALLSEVWAQVAVYTEADRLEDEREGYCDSVASRRDDHQRDE